MADTQSNIKVSIDTTEALASIKNLQRQISAFHTSMAKSGAAANAVTNQMQQNLINSINATGKFSAQMRTIKTSTESFTNALEKNKLSLGEYFRYAGGASKSFGRLFKTEFDTINKVARENVKDLQTQYIKLGRDANGAMKAISVRPLSLDMNDLATKTMIASEKQALLNQLLKQGSTNLLNFGKNTQWAGRQLMVGFTIPLMAVGSAAAKTFMDMETQVIRFKKVYGDLFTPTEETAAALDDITALGKEFTKYGIAVSETVGLASEAAAAGFKGLDLQRQTAAATKLSILGQVESQKALETTIALQNAFSMSSADLATNIDFLNAVENQTVLSLDDMSTAIPKAAPVIQQLGGDVKDLAFFMTAMKEGGINASEGANALKSGLASMINPTGKANELLLSFGINTKKIVESNRGNLKKTVIDFATALNQLDPLNRAQAIEQMFGKFQFARLSTLFANVTKDGTQAARVLDLAGASIQDLASMSEKELGMTSESAMNKFKSAVESLKLSLVPVGEEFLKAVTPIAEFVTKILDKFNNLGDGTKKVIVTMTALVAGLGPVLLMTFGLLANGIANIIKGFTTVKTIFNKTGQATGVLGEEVQYMTLEQRNAAAVAASLDQVHRKLAQTFTSEAAAVDALTNAYARAIAKQAQFGGPIVGRGSRPKKYAKGKPYVVGGTGNKDSELSLLTPGETVIPKDRSKKYGMLINGIIADNIPGYSQGKGSITGTLFGNPATFSRQGTAAALEAKINSLDEGLQAIVKDALPKIIEGFNGASISVESFGKALADKVRSGELAVPKSALSAFGEKSYSAPDAISKQTRTMDWASRAEEEAAIAKAIAPYNPTEAQSKNIIGRDASHITQALATDATGNKIWDPSNLQADSAALNKYMEQAKGRMQKFAESTEKADKLVSEVAKDLGMAEKAVRDRLSRLAQGDQPQTKADYALLSGFAAQDVKDPKNKSPYMAAGAKAVADIRVKDNSYVEALAKGDVTAYNKTFKKNAKDPALNSRDRKSPHPSIPKDAQDDAKKYSEEFEKESKKQAKKKAKKRRAASRAQGPAPIGPVIPAGTQELSIVPPLTPAEKRKDRRQKQRTKLMSGAKAVGSKLGTRLGGGTALLGANMALGAMPDFAGKELVQSTMTGANMGMLFGPWGAAAGAAIGLVSSAIGNLIEKQKQHKAMNEAVFKSSADLATFFGNAVVDTEMRMGSFSASLGVVGTTAENVGKSFGYTNEELKTFTDLVASLPENNPLRALIDGLANEDSPEKINKVAQAFVTTQVALGQIKPEQAQKTLDLILSSSGHADMVGSSFMNLKTQTEAVSASLKNASKNSAALGTSMTQLVGAAGNATSLAQLTMILDGIAASGISAAAALNSMYYAYLQVGNLQGATAVQALEKVSGITAEQTALVLAAAQKGFSANINAMTDAKKLAADAEKFLNDPKVWKSASGSGSGTKDYQGEAKVKSFKKEIDLLKAKKKLIDDQIKKEQRISDELKKQNDYRAKQASLDKQIVEAKIRGNYIDAANLLQEKKNNTAEFNQGNKVSALQLQSDALQEKIDKLQASSDAVVAAVNNTTSAVSAGAASVVSAIGSINFTGPTGASKSQAISIATDKETVQSYIDTNKKKVSVATRGGAAQVRMTPSYIDAKAAWDGRPGDQKKQAFEDYIRYKMAPQIKALKNDEDGIVVSAVGSDGKTYKFNVKKNGDFIRIAEKKEEKKAKGGLIKGPGTGTSDSIKATLGYAGGGQLRVSNGEFVVKASSVKDYGLNAMNAVNNGTATISANGGGTVYNINMPITSNSADARQVANEVMAKLKLELNKSNKTNKVSY